MQYVLSHSSTITKGPNMKNMGIIETLGGRDYMITFSFLAVISIVIVWCLASAILTPLLHLSCPLLSVF